MNLSIGALTALDLSSGFLDTLSGLADVQLTTEEARRIFRNRLRLGVRTYVARAEVEGVVGTVTLLVEDKFIHSGGRVGHIEDVVVRPGFEKQGIGGALVQHAIEEARKLGCYKVILNCFERLVPFYEQLGFRRHDVGMRLDF
jgi:glucosamine-phosphate N-acetyltransferase